MRNFEPFVLARTTTYRDGLKTHSRHVKGAHVGPKTPGKYWDLSWFKKVLVVILKAPYKLLTSQLLNENYVLGNF